MRFPSLKTLSIAGITVSVLLLLRVACFNHLENFEVGLTWNIFSGDTVLQERSGWHIRAPWVFVTTLDTRPTRVCITSAAHASVNCRLVRFVPEEYQSFISIEGFKFFWWSNRFSINFGYREEYRGFKDVLRGYAYSNEEYPFVEIIETY